MMQFGKYNTSACYIKVVYSTDIMRQSAVSGYTNKEGTDLESIKN